MLVVVITQTHDLIPVAWRLALEGNEVQLIVLQDSAESAWAGQERLPRRLNGADKRDPAKRLQLAQEIIQTDGVVLTDSRKWSEDLQAAGVEKVFGPARLSEAERPGPPPVTLGGWFNGVDAITAPHVVVADQGLWPGGRLGPTLTGGLTLIAPRSWPPALQAGLDAAIPALQAAKYRGLVRIALRGREEGAIAPEDVYLGWGWLHTHAFIAELGDAGPGLGDVLLGAEAKFPSTYTMVVPVSMGPWPGMTTRRQGWPSVEIPKESRSGDIFFHGIQFFAGTVWAGAPQEDADGGLVGVARGTANSLGLARGRALTHAQTLAAVLPEPQFRVDIGADVEEAIATLEAKGLGIL